MTEHERQMVITLCAQISEEKNPAVFGQLLVELDGLLEKLNNHQARRSEFEIDNTAN